MALRMRVRGGAWLLLFSQGRLERRARAAQRWCAAEPGRGEGEGGRRRFAWVERLQRAARPQPGREARGAGGAGALQRRAGPLQNCSARSPRRPPLARLYLLPEEADVEDGALGRRCQRWLGAAAAAGAGPGGDAVVGFEFSGRLSSGRRVMGMRMGGCVSTEIIAPEFLLWDHPRYLLPMERRFF
ncbi:Protein of unknown function [Gryllus bimaculatus]|nr:Protein of unknown function [Gryllus bimaculatus]